MPDGASLERLDYREGTLTLSGRAQNAPALIAQIETSPLFTEVKFAAPTTRRDGEDGVQFSVSAKVAGSGAAALPLQR